MKTNKKYYITEIKPFIQEIKDIDTGEIVGHDNFVQGATEQVEEDGGIVVGITDINGISHVGNKLNV